METRKRKSLDDCKDDEKSTKKFNFSSEFLIHVVDSHSPSCDLIQISNALLSSGSPIFKNALEYESTVENKYFKDKECKLSCAHKECLENKSFSEIQVNSHRSITTVKDFFVAFKPFADWRIKICLQNVHEWIELAEEFCVPTVLDYCYQYIRTRVAGCVESEKECLITIIGVLEKFHQQDLLQKVLQSTISIDAWRWFPKHQHFQCCISKEIPWKLLEISQRRVFDIHECLDDHGKLCLVKVIEVKALQARIHYIGWEAGYDTWVSMDKLIKPVKGNCVADRYHYRPGRKDELLRAVEALKE